MLERHFLQNPEQLSPSSASAAAPTATAEWPQWSCLCAGLLSHQVLL